MPFGTSGYKLFNSTAYDRKRESVKSEPVPGFSTAPTYEQFTAPSRPTPTFSQYDNAYYNDWLESQDRRSGLDRIFDALQVGQYTVAGAVRGIVSKDHTVLGGIVGGLRAANPLGQGFERGEASFTDVLSEAGWNPTSKKGKVARGIVGFAGDVLLDPLTYFSGGATALLKGTGKVAAKIGPKVGRELVEKFGREAAEKIAAKASTKLGQGLTREVAEELLLKSGREITNEAVEGLIKRTNKFAGISQDLGNHLKYGIGKNKKIVLDESVLRMIGDKTIAPYVNSIPNVVNNLGIFKKMDAKSALKALSRYDLDQTAATLLAQDLRKRHSVSLAKNIVSSKKTMAKITDGLTETQKFQVLDLLDNSELWRGKLETTGLVDNVFGKQLIEGFQKQLDDADGVIAGYNKLLKDKEKLIEKAEGINSVIAKLDRGKINTEIGKMKAFRAVLDDTQKKINLSLFDINNEVRTDMFKHTVVDHRNAYKTGKLRTVVQDGKEIQKDIFTNVPYGHRKAGDILKSVNGPEYSFAEFLEKPMNDFSKLDGKRAYATSSKSINNFLAIKHSNEVMYKKLDDVMKKTPLLSDDFGMMPLRSTLTDKQLKKALNSYANDTADEFFDYSKTLREGYDEAKSIADVEFAGKKIGKDYFNRIDELIVNEPERLELYIKNINASDSLVRSNKMKAIKGKDYKALQLRKNKLDDKILSGTISNAELVELDELSKELTIRNKRLMDTGQLNVAQAKAKSSFGVLSDAEIDNVLKTDYFGKTKQALKQQEFDPWEDVANVSKKANESDEFIDAYVGGSDIVRDGSKFVDTEDFNLGKPFVEGEAIPESVLKAKAFDQITGVTKKVKPGRISDEARSIIQKKADAKNIAAQAKKEDLRDYVNNLFNQTPEENIAKIKNKQLRDAQQAKLASATIDSAKDRAKKYDLTQKQIDNLDKYLKIDFDSISKKIEGMNKRRARMYKKSLLQKYFPDKRLKDISPAEREIIDGMMDDALERGLVEQVDTEKFYDALLEKTDIKISELDDQMEAIEVNLQKTKEGYWVQNTDLNAQIQSIDEVLQDKIYLGQVEDAQNTQRQLSKAFRDNQLDDYARTQLGMAYNQFVDWKFKDFSKIMDEAELLRRGVDPKVIDSAKDIRKLLDDMAIIEESNVVKGYFPHIVQEKHKHLFDNYTELAENAVVGSDGRPFISSQLERNWKGSIDDFTKAWDETVAKGGIPTFADTGIKVPRDLYETDLVKALTERAIKHENFVFDKKNMNKIYDLVTRKFELNKVPTGFDVPVVTKENLIKVFKNRVPKGTQLTSDYVIEQLANRGVFVNFRANDLYAEVIDGADILFKLTENNKRLFNVRNMDQSVLNHFNQLSKYQKAEGIQHMLDAYDKMLHLWKLNVTVVNPSFHARNALGNSFNSYLDIGIKSFDFKQKKKIRDIMTGAFKGDIVTKTGKKYSAEEILQIGIQFDVIDSGQFGYEIRKLMESSKKSATKWAKYNPLSTTEFLPYKVGTKVGSDIENMDRLLNFVHHLEEGLDPALAADFTNKFLFDYKNATVFEKEVLRRAIPFWTWAKKNIPLQMEQVIKHPEKYRPFVKGLQAIDKSNVGDPNINFDRSKDAGEFAQDWITLPGTGEKGVKIYNPNMPFQDLSVDLKSLIGRLSPFIKAPAELALNRDFYYGNELDGRLSHIAKQIGPLSNTKKLVKKEGEDRVLEIIAQLAGLRFLSYDQEKYNYRKLVDEIDKNE